MSVNWCWLQNFIFFFFPFLLTAHCLFCCKQSLKKIKPSVGSLFKSVAIFSTSLPHENVFHRHKQSRLNPQLVPFSNPSHPQTANTSICARYLCRWGRRSSHRQNCMSAAPLPMRGKVQKCWRQLQLLPHRARSWWRPQGINTLRRAMSSQSLFQLEVFADRPPNVVFRFSIVHSTLALSVQLWFQGHPATATAVCELGWAPDF